MGLFDRFKKETKEVNRTAEVENDDSKIIILSMELKNKVKHRNNVVTNLYMARVASSEHAIIIDNADYVSFELPEGQKVDNKILQLVKQRYSRENTNDIATRKSYYLGQLQQMGQELYFGNKSNAVNEIVEKMVNEDISKVDEYNERKYQEKREAQEKIDREKAFREEMSAKQYLESERQERENRKNNPEIKNIGRYVVDGRSRFQYDAVNINSGEILRIRNTSKICKDQEGTYLYTAQISNTAHEHDAEIFGASYPVCFELYRRLEDIVELQDKGEILKVLELLSDPKNFQDRNKLAYIGQIDKNGQINRREMSNSPALAGKIKELQQNFEMNKQKSEQEWQQ